MSTRTRDSFIYAIFTLISFLQALLVVISRKISSNSGLLLFGFAIAGILWAIKSLLKRDSRLLPVFLFYFSQLGLFIFIAPTIQIVLVPRLLFAVVILIHCAIFLVVLLVGLRITTFDKAVLLAFSTAFAIFFCESLMSLLHSTPPGNEHIGPEWTGTLNPHPLLGCVYQPHSERRTYYPGNPRGYFRRQDAREQIWNLRVVSPNVANLVLPSDRNDDIRVEIKKEATKTASDIQANQPFLNLKVGAKYLIRFRAKSDRPRSMIIGFARAHPPWSGLGLSEKLDLTDQWQNFEKAFQANADDQNARIHFDLGADAPSVEIDSLTVEDILNHTPIHPAVAAKKFFVSYQFNSLGCRAPDYSLTKDSGIVRILLLGDSYTLGVGVHEQDTFGHRLEQLLNKNAASVQQLKYEVINCGVSGYGTHEERLFYELFGERYHPDIVILSMVSNDDTSFLEEVKRGYVNRTPGKLELIFNTWGKTQDFRHRRPLPDFNKSLGEIILLNRNIQKDGAHLLADIFRNDGDYSGSTQHGKDWNNLTDTVSKGLQGTQIPFIDLGKALFQNRNQDFTVYGDFDRHPNEIAHRIAAEELFRQLHQLHWIKE